MSLRKREKNPFITNLIFLVDNYNDRKCTIAGWGRMFSNGGNSKYLKATRVYVQPIEQCLKSPIGSLVEPNAMICAYSKNADACQVIIISRKV